MSNVFISSVLNTSDRPSSFSDYVELCEARDIESEAEPQASYGPGFALVNHGHFEVKSNSKFQYVAGPAFISFKLYARLRATDHEPAPSFHAWRVRSAYIETLKYDEELIICPLEGSIKASGRIQSPVPILHTKSGIFAVSCSEGVLGWETIASIEQPSIFRKHTDSGSYLIWRPQRSRVVEKSAEPVDLAIIGAGPAGLSLAAWAQESGISYQVFGEPLSFWKRHIPPLCLRSPPVATNLSSPRPGHTYLDFARDHGIEDGPQIEMSDFIGYATEFCDTHGIRTSHGFIQTIQYRDNCWGLKYGEETLLAKNVAIAIGLNGSQRNPGLPDAMSPMWNYVGNIHDYGRFKGQRVAVVGGGQSGVEAALLAAGAGADVHLAIREDGVKFRSLHAPGEWFYRNLFKHSRLLMPLLPGFAQDRLLAYLLEGTAEPALKDRLEQGDITLHTNASIAPIETHSATFVIRRPCKEPVDVDYVIVAAGFNYDIRKMKMFVDLPILERGGLPILNRYAMSSMPNLYFTGMSALRLVGPQCQFVSGSGVMSPRIISGIKARLSK